MTAEAKVGAFTLVGLILFGSIVAGLGGFSLFGEPGYTVYVGYKQVLGLNPDADVRFAGIRAGKVKAIEPEGQGVKVTISINEGIRVPKDAQFSLGSDSMLGDRFVLISPAGSTSTEYLKDGDYVYASSEATMEDVMAGISDVLHDVQDLLHSMNDVIGDPHMKDSIIHSAENLQQMTVNMREVTAVLARVAANNESNANRILENLAGMTANLNAAAATVEQMSRDVSGDGETAANLRLTLLNVKDASEDIKKIAAGIANVAGDPEVQENARVTIKNAREVTEKANSLLKNGLGLAVDPTVDVYYTHEDDDWMTDFNVDVSMNRKDYLRLGVEDIGDGNDLNLMVGKRGRSFGARAGIIAGDPGVGVDAYLGKNVRLSADAYDMNDVRVRLGAEYKFSKDTSVLGRFTDVNDRRKRAGYLGIRHAF
ncbi:hypothetical protein TAMA11512_06730 [Selenomonas sp. TAMA-11512]|uniref:MlaD family protein n=1 Tax=Selenomonas sp. TAMA-11512 TaxID=3095337 RepID=UPI0030890D5C|nr:hypothetical protein TAMA11512_06730 [Selenomonas sp. TAMA-11512]